MNVHVQQRQICINSLKQKKHTDENEAKFDCIGGGAWPVWLINNLVFGPLCLPPSVHNKEVVWATRRRADERHSN